MCNELNGMSKPKVDEIQYAKLLHEKMQEHGMYKEGMDVVTNPESSEKPLVLTVIGGNSVFTIMSWAEKEVHKEYELVITH